MAKSKNPTTTTSAAEQPAPQASGFTPSKGRIVRYVTSEADGEPGKEWTANIVHVLDDGRVNLACWTPEGMPVVRAGVSVSASPSNGACYYPARGERWP